MPSALEQILVEAVKSHQQGNLVAAERGYRTVLDAQPKHPDALNLLGVIHHQRGDNEAAEKNLRKALSVAKKNPFIHLNMGTVLTALGQLKKAESHYQQAVKFAPENIEALYNLGTNLLEQGRAEEALKKFEKAVKLDPSHLMVNWNIALTSILLGRLAEGFAAYEWRMQVPGYLRQLRTFPQPKWDGGTVDGTILLWAEQGVGDEILFASIFSDVLERANKVRLECDPRLIPLFKRSFQGLECIVQTTPPAQETADADIVAQCATGSLPGLFRTEDGAFPDRESYLVADVKKTVLLRERYRSLGDGPLVGIAWKSGNPGQAVRRSVSLQDWEPILKALDDMNGVIVNLQYGDTAADRKGIEDAMGISIHHDSDVDQLKSLDDFAAQVAALDRVITIDNSTAHMAGALGVPVWVMLPLLPDCRWMLNREDSPWYPSARLFRQGRDRDWGKVLAAVAAALEKTV